MYIFKIIFISVQAANPSAEQALITTLLHSYDRNARPVLDRRRPTNVTFGLEVVQLVNVVRVAPADINAAVKCRACVSGSIWAGRASISRQNSSIRNNRCHAKYTNKVPMFIDNG